MTLGYVRLTKTLVLRRVTFLCGRHYKDLWLTGLLSGKEGNVIKTCHGLAKNKSHQIIEVP